MPTSASSSSPMFVAVDSISSAVEGACSTLDTVGGLNSYRSYIALASLRKAIAGIGRPGVDGDDDGVAASEGLLLRLLAVGPSPTNTPRASSSWSRILLHGFSQIADMRVPQVTCHCAADVFFLMEGVVARRVSELSAPVGRDAQQGGIQDDGAWPPHHQLVRAVAQLLRGFISPPPAWRDDAPPQVNDGSRHPLLDDGDEDDTPLSLLKGLLSDYSEGVLLGCFAVVAAVTQSVYAISALCDEFASICAGASDEDADLRQAFALLQTVCGDVVDQLYSSGVMSQVVGILSRRTEGIAAKSSFTPKTTSNPVDDEPQETDADIMERIKRRDAPTALSGFKLCPEPGQAMEGDDELSNDAGVVLVQPPMSSVLSGVASTPSTLAASTGSLTMGAGSRPPSSNRPTSSNYRSVSGRISSAFHNQRRALVASFGESSAQIIALGLQVVCWHYQRLGEPHAYTAFEDGADNRNDNGMRDPESSTASGAFAIPRLEQLKNTLVLLLRHCVGVQAATTKSQLGGLGSGPSRVGPEIPTALSFTAKLAVPVARTIHHILLWSSSPSHAMWRATLLGDTILPAVNRYCMLLLMLGRMSDASDRRHQILLLTNTVDALCKLGLDVIQLQRRYSSAVGGHQLGDEHARLLHRLFNAPTLPIALDSARSIPDVSGDSSVPPPGGDSPARCSSPVAPFSVLRNPSSSHPGSVAGSRHGTATFQIGGGSFGAAETLHFIPSLLSLKGSFLNQGNESRCPSTGSLMVDTALLYVSASLWRDLVSPLLASGLCFCPSEVELLLDGAVREAVEDALDVAADCMVASVFGGSDALVSYSLGVRDALSHTHDVVLGCNAPFVLVKGFVTGSLCSFLNWYATTATGAVHGVKTLCVSSTISQRTDIPFMEGVAATYSQTCSGTLLETTKWLHARLRTIRRLLQQEKQHAEGDQTVVFESVVAAAFHGSLFDLTSVFYLVLDLCEVQLSDLLNLGEESETTQSAETWAALQRLDNALTPVQRETAEELFQLMLLVNTNTVESLSHLITSTFSSQSLASGRGAKPVGGSDRHRAASNGGGRRRGGSRSGSARRLRTMTPTQLLDGRRSPSACSSARGRGPQLTERPRTHFWPNLQDADEAHDLMVAVVPILNALLQMSQQFNIPSSTVIAHPGESPPSNPSSDTPTYWMQLLTGLAYVLGASDDYPLRVVTLYTVHNALVAMTSKTFLYHHSATSPTTLSPKSDALEDANILRLVRPMRPSGRGGDNPRSASTGFSHSSQVQEFSSDLIPHIGSSLRFGQEALVACQLVSIPVEMVSDIVARSVWSENTSSAAPPPPSLLTKGSLRDMVHALRRSDDGGGEPLPLSNSPSRQNPTQGHSSALWTALSGLATSALAVLAPTRLGSSSSSATTSSLQGEHADLSEEGAMEILQACCIVAEQLLMLCGKAGDAADTSTILVELPSPLMAVAVRFVSLEREYLTAAASSTFLPPQPSCVMQLLLLWLQFDVVRKALSQNPSVLPAVNDVVQQMPQSTEASPFALFLDHVQDLVSVLMQSGAKVANVAEAWRYVGCQIAKYRAEQEDRDTKW